MPTFQAPADGAQLFYRYYTPSSSPHRGPPTASAAAHQPLTLVFLHGWPMSSRMFDALITPLVETHRFRVLAPDRRGFGRSDWATPATGEVTRATFVRDAAALLEHVLQRQPPPADFVFVGASMGAAESLLARAASHVLRARCRGFVWIGPSMPYPAACAACPGAPGAETWDGLIEGFRGAGGKEFVERAVPGVFRADLGNDVGAATLRFFEGLVGEADPVAVERTAVILQKPVAEELEQLAREGSEVPVLLMHGDSDSGMPVEASSAVVHGMLPWSRLRVYEKGGHGIYLTHTQQVLDDLLAFLKPIVEQCR